MLTSSYIGYLSKAEAAKINIHKNNNMILDIPSPSLLPATPKKKNNKVATLPDCTQRVTLLKTLS